MGEWTCYKSATGSFHTKKLCSRLCSTEVNFYSKNEKWLFEPHFRGLRGNIHTPSIARWKARGRLSIRHNWTFFTIFYGWDVTSGNLSKSPFFEGEWVTLSKYLTGKGASPTNHFRCQKTRVIAVSCGIKMSAVHHLVLSQYTHLTGGQMDWRTDRNETAISCVALHAVAR